MAKHLLLFLGVLTAGCIDESPPAEQLYGQYAVTRTLEYYWQHADVEFAPQVMLALQSEQVVVQSDRNRDAVVLRHDDDEVWFELYETGWSLPGSDVAFAVVGYELREITPGHLVGRAGASLQNDAGQARAGYGFDVVAERLAPE